MRHNIGLLCKECKEFVDKFKKVRYCEGLDRYESINKCPHKEELKAILKLIEKQKK